MNLPQPKPTTYAADELVRSLYHFLETQSILPLLTWSSGDANLPRDIRRCPRNENRFEVRFMGTTFTYPSREAAEERSDGGTRSGMMKRGELPVPSTVENLRLWLISGGEKGIRQTVDPGQAGYEILIKRYLEDRRKRVKDGNLSHQSYQSDLSQLELFKAYCEQADPAVTTISEADLDAFKVWVATHSTKDRPEGFCRKPKSIHYAVSRIKHMVEWGWSKRLLDDMPET